MLAIFRYLSVVAYERSRKLSVHNHLSRAIFQLFGFLQYDFVYVAFVPGKLVCKLAVFYVQFPVLEHHFSFAVIMELGGQSQRDIPGGIAVDVTADQVN
jgi:hypothetical protein